MFYILTIKDHVRVEPELFALPVRQAVIKQLEKTYAEHFDKELGAVVKVISVDEVGEGIIIPGDAAVYYDTQYKLLVFQPELNEIVYGIISQITSFGAFVNLGVVEGLIHISQTMDDYVTFGKTNVLLGRNSKKSLKPNDLCLARIVAISYKTRPPKIGLTMRQAGLGKLEWIAEAKRKAKQQVASGKKEKKK